MRRECGARRVPSHLPCLHSEMNPGWAPASARLAGSIGQGRGAAAVPLADQLLSSCWLACRLCLRAELKTRSLPTTTTPAALTRPPAPWISILYAQSPSAAPEDPIRRRSEVSVPGSQVKGEVGTRPWAELQLTAVGLQVDTQEREERGERVLE